MERESTPITGMTAVALPISASHIQATEVTVHECLPQETPPHRARAADGEPSPSPRPPRQHRHQPCPRADRGSGSRPETHEYLLDSRPSRPDDVARVAVDAGDRPALP